MTGVKAPVDRIAVLGHAFRAKRESGHCRPRAGIGGAAHDAEPRSAMRAVHERIKMAPFSRGQHFRVQAAQIVVSGDILVCGSPVLLSAIWKLAGANWQRIAHQPVEQRVDVIGIRRGLGSIRRRCRSAPRRLQFARRPYTVRLKPTLCTRPRTRFARRPGNLRLRWARRRLSRPRICGIR